MSAITTVLSKKKNNNYIDGDFLGSTMDMHHCWISSTYDRFMFKNHHLRIKFPSRFDWLRSITKHKTGRDIFLFDSLQIRQMKVNKTVTTTAVPSRPLTFNLILTFSPPETDVTSSSSDHIWSTDTCVRLGMTSKFCPFLQKPDSTLPITTVPISLYLSTIGIMNGPSNLRLSEGNWSINGMNATPRYHGQIDSSISSFIPKPFKPDTGMNVKSLAGLKLKWKTEHKIVCVKNVFAELERVCVLKSSNLNLPEFL